MSRTVTAATSLLTLTILAACSGPAIHGRWGSAVRSDTEWAKASVLDAAKLDAKLASGTTDLNWKSKRFPANGRLRRVTLSLAIAGDPTNVEELWLSLREDEQVRRGREATGSELLAITRPFGGLTFLGNRQDEEYRGTLRLRVQSNELAVLTQAGWAPTVRDAIRLIAADVRAADLAEFREIANTTSLRLASALARYDASHTGFREFTRDGFDYDEDAVIKLLHRRVDIGQPSAWKATGRTLTADEVIYCRQRNLTTDNARAWDDVDTKLTIKQLYWAKQRRVQAKQHAEWQNAGSELTLEQLYWANQRRLAPDEFRSWKEAGHPLDLKQLYWVKQRRIAAKDHRAWADIGQELTLENLYWTKQVRLSAELAKSWSDLDYKWTIKQLYDLKNRRVTPRFASGFLEAGFQNPSIEELVRYRNLNLKPADVRKLRRRKPVKK